MNDILLVIPSEIVTPSVLEAESRRKDPSAASEFLDRSNKIKQKMSDRMGPEGRYIFNNLFSEATICDTKGNNLVNGEYYSFIGLANNKLYFSKNTVDSDIYEYSIFPSEVVSNENNEINVSDVQIPEGIVDNALEQSDNSSEVQFNDNVLANETIDGVPFDPTVPGESPMSMAPEEVAPVEVESVAEEVAPVETEPVAEEVTPVEVAPIEEPVQEEIAPVEVEAVAEEAAPVEAEPIPEEVIFNEPEPEPVPEAVAPVEAEPIPEEVAPVNSEPEQMLFNTDDSEVEDTNERVDYVLPYSNERVENEYVPSHYNNVRVETAHSNFRDSYGNSTSVQGGDIVSVMDALINQNTSLKGQISEFENRINQMMAENDELRKKVIFTDEANRRLKTKVDSLTKDNDRLASQIKNFENKDRRINQLTSKALEVIGTDVNDYRNNNANSYLDDYYYNGHSNNSGYNRYRA